MTKKTTTSVLILLLILFVFILKVIVPAVGSTLLKQDRVKSSEKITGKGIVAEDTSLSPPDDTKPEIVIDPGHGGIDTGVKKGHVVESEITLDISSRLKSLLDEESFLSEMTRSTDTSLFELSDISGTHQKRELNARSKLINESGAKIFVSIHVNSYPKHPEMSGSIVYYNPLMPQSRELSEYIQKQLNIVSARDFKRDRHKPQEAGFYLLKNSIIPGVLVETAFITNSADYRLLKQDYFKSKIAKAVADGIGNYMSVYLRK